MTETLAPFLLPDGFDRPRMRALLREGSVIREAGRLVLHRGVRRRARRNTPYVEAGGPRPVEPVLLVPGFLAGDWTLKQMSRDLRQRGFRTYRSSIHANVNCVLNSAALVEARLEAIAERRGSKVNIVGHSLGGMIARGLAVRRPDLVAGIVTMGSPMLAPAAHHQLLTSGVQVLTKLNRAGVRGVMGEECVAGRCAELAFHESHESLSDGLAMTNIYSRRDGIVDWKACIDPLGRHVEVTASHVGMAVDPEVIEAVAQALSRLPDRRATLVDDATA